LLLYHASFESDTSIFYDIELGENEIHEISIDNWEQLHEAEIIIKIDKGMDEIYEDTLCLRCLTNDIEDQDWNELQKRSFVIYPNPLEDRAMITYKLKSPAIVTIDVYDIYGRKLKTLVDEYQTEGKKYFEWQTGAMLSGIYYIHLRVGQNQFIKKAIIAK